MHMYIHSMYIILMHTLDIVKAITSFGSSTRFAFLYQFSFILCTHVCICMYVCMYVHLAIVAYQKNFLCLLCPTVNMLKQMYACAQHNIYVHIFICACVCAYSNMHRHAFAYMYVCAKWHF